MDWSTYGCPHGAFGVCQRCVENLELYRLWRQRRLTRNDVRRSGVIPELVFISPGGQVFHGHPACSSWARGRARSASYRNGAVSEPVPVDLATAVDRGRGPCADCFPLPLLWPKHLGGCAA